MASYRKKPVVIEAVQIPAAGTLLQDVPEWLQCAIDDGVVIGATQAQYPGSVLIGTIEGVMRGDPSDWIIRGVKGELHPCKPDIFAATYEPVEA